MIDMRMTYITLVWGFDIAARVGEAILTEGDNEVFPSSRAYNS